MLKSYKSTTYACYLANFTQALIINLTPILFIPLRELFGLTLTELSILTLINFVAQIASDICFSGLIDKYGFRIFAEIASALAAVGLIMFALSPVIFKDAVYVGLIIGTLIFSVAGGLLEVLLSPIVNSIPTDAKDKAMSVLHSFYAWGQVVVVVVTTLLVYFMDAKNWQYIVLIWLILPIATFIMFAIVPFAPPILESKRSKFSSIAKNPMFILCLLVILAGGATEQIIAQWSSAFLEVGMGMPKIWGDMIGVVGFAVTFGIGRLIYGKFGEKLNLELLMLIGLISSVVCYIIIAFSPNAFLTIIVFMLVGFSVSLLWPGALSIASSSFPLAGSAMFAILAMGGDIGCSSGPLLTGIVSDSVIDTAFVQELMLKYSLTAEEIGMRAGILVAAIIPLIGSVVMTFIYIKKTKERKLKSVNESIDQVTKDNGDAEKMDGATD